MPLLSGRIIVHSYIIDYDSIPGVSLDFPFSNITVRTMKYARAFSTALKTDGYPEEWLHSAVSYKQLKKCIKSIQKELVDMGLDVNTLAHIWGSHGDFTEKPYPLQYTLGGLLVWTFSLLGWKLSLMCASRYGQLQTDPDLHHGYKWKTASRCFSFS